METRRMKILSVAWLLLALAGALRADAAQLWLYCSKNLWVDKNIDELQTLFARAGKAGYTHVLLTDSKFSKLGDMDAHYFRNIERVKQIAAQNHLEIVPALFSIGYSNDLLWHDPNLVEALPIRDALFVVKGGEARLVPEVSTGFKGGDLTNLKDWDWHDETVVTNEGAVLIKDPKGQNARLSQKLKLTPFRQYHISVRVKAQDFRGTPEVKVLAGGRALNYNSLGVKRTQDWTTHHAVFNSLNNTNAQLYLGCWGGQTGSLWFDDVVVEEVGLVNLVRREGAPLVIRSDGSNTALIEGQDFEHLIDPRMGVKPWKGEYDIYHDPPVIKATLPDGTRLRVSYYYAATTLEDQAMICPSEPKTIELLRDQARRMHDAWHAKGYMMSFDEIRVLNWCAACEKRHLDAGTLLADAARTCAKILREANPGGRIYVWSDMFDPNHNAHKDYYLVRGDLTGSWEGLEPDITIIPWYFERRAASLKFFADRGHRQVIAGYYDHAPEQATEWLKAAQPFSGVEGIMYTTWEHKFNDLERFAEIVKASEKR
jgi:hypothetical protein